LLHRVKQSDGCGKNVNPLISAYNIVILGYPGGYQLCRKNTPS
jgi:hypothetical protein